mgnify:CR=1 FL=1
MTFGKKRKIDKPQVIKMKKRTLDQLRDGSLQVGPCKKKIKDGLTEAHKKMIFGHPVLHVPTEIDYFLAQTIEGMGYEQKDVRVAFYEGREEIRFEIFPPESV